MSIKFRSAIGSIKVLSKVPNRTALNSTSGYIKVQRIETEKRKNDVKVRNLEYTNMQKFR